MSRFEVYHMRRPWIGLLSGSLLALWAQTGMTAPAPGTAGATAPSPAKAGTTPVLPSKVVGPCAKSYQEAREHLEAGRLRQARGGFTGCAKTSCGGVTSQLCLSGLQRLERDTPSVIAVVKDGSGADLVDVRVSVDGELVASHIDGRSLDVDPGMHEFSFSSDLGGTHTERVLILEGQRNRVISVVLAGVPAASVGGAIAAQPSASTAAELAPSLAASKNDDPATLRSSERSSRAPAAVVDSDTSKTTPVLAYVVGGVGLAAVGSSLLLAHWGSEDNLKLDRCAPNCSRDSVDHVSNMYLAADITLGAGVIALGAATWLYLSHSGVEKPAREQAYRFDVQPTASGAFATVRGAF